MFDLEKAKLLANICRATYESEPTLSEYAQSLSDSKLIESADESFPLKTLSGFINEELIIAYQGTVIAHINQETDIFLDMLVCIFCNFIHMSSISPEKLNYLIDEQQVKNTYGGEIHIGFALLMEKIFFETQAVIEELKPRKICLTGYSLGGALATLAAYRLKKQNFPVSSVYTFGAPRVGDSAFASSYKNFGILHFRIENKNDIVPHLPPDYHTREKFKFTTQFSNDILSLFRKFGFSIIDELHNLQIPDINYPPVGILEFINWNKEIVENSDDLRQRRLLYLPSSILEIRKSLLLDHDLKAYSEELTHCKIEQTKEQTMPSSKVEEIVYNTVVLGKSGAGKSSLINYLYGDTIAKAGVGEPVTEKGFHKYNLTWKDITVNIYDSSGLEVGNQHTEWKKMLDDELKNHSIDRPVSEWFHTIFYCFDADHGRVESFEFDIIKKLMESQYRVIIVLTRAGKVSLDNLRDLKECIQKGTSLEIPIIEVCSVIEKTRIGITNTFGKDELEKETMRGFWNAITVRLPQRCEYVLHKEVDKWCNKQKEYLNIPDSEYKFKKAQINETIEKNYNKFFDQLKNDRYNLIIGEIKNIVGYYHQLVAILEYPPPEDLPIFKSEKERLLSHNLIIDMVSLLEQAQLSVFRTIGKLIHALLPDTRHSIRVQIDTFGRALKQEITNQKPELSQILERIRRDTPILRLNPGQ